MNQNKVRDAVEEARRFVERGEAWLIADGNKEPSYVSIPKESGAVRRASMDLTRALATMRTPG